MARHHKLQKSSKHKKIKAIDPFYTGPRRDMLFKAGKNSNKPPSDLSGGQEIPRKVRELMKAKEQLKSSEGGDTRRSVQKVNSHTSRNPAAPVFKKGKYESVASFYRRMDKAAQESITKAELETQFDVKFERSGKNKLTLSSQTDPVLDLDGDAKPETTKTTKSQKRKDKLKQKVEEKAILHRDEFDDFHDTVKFGEVVEAPPQINAAPRKAPEIKKAGGKRLLCTEVFRPVIQTIPEKRSLFDKLPELDHLDTSAVQALRQEEARRRAVDTYRKMKKSHNAHKAE